MEQKEQKQSKPPVTREVTEALKESLPGAIKSGSDFAGNILTNTFRGLYLGASWITDKMVAGIRAGKEQKRQK